MYRYVVISSHFIHLFLVPKYKYSSSSPFSGKHTCLITVRKEGIEIFNWNLWGNFCGCVQGYSARAPQGWALPQEWSLSPAQWEHGDEVGHTLTYDLTWMRAPHKALLSTRQLNRATIWQSYNSCVIPMVSKYCYWRISSNILPPEFSGKVSILTITLPIISLPRMTFFVLIPFRSHLYCPVYSK